MKLLAFDLSWSGPTGWVYWNDYAPDPIVDYGSFKIKLPNKSDGAMKTMSGCKQIYDIVKEIASGLPLDYVVYEYTDWHRNLDRKHGWKVEYAMEREAQRTLGRAEGAFLVACASEAIRVIGIGAREAKQEFGALDKARVAELVSCEYPRFRFVEPEFDPVKMKHIDRDWYLIDETTQKEVPHHVSDAIVIAKVCANRLRLTSAETV